MSDCATSNGWPPHWHCRLDEWVTALCWAPNARWLAAGAADGTVAVFDARDGTCMHRWIADPSGVQDLDWSADSEWLAVAGQNDRVGIWRADDGARVAVFRPQAGWVEAIAWSPTAPMLAVAAGPGVSVVDPHGELTWSSAAHRSTVSALEWATSGELLSTAAYGGLTMWSLAKAAEPVGEFRANGSFLSVALSPNGRVLASGCQDCSVHFWRLETGKDSEMRGYDRKPLALAWDTGSRWLATGGVGEVLIWDFAGDGPEGTPPLITDGHDALVTAVDFHPGLPLLASGAVDGSILLSDMVRQAHRLRLARLDGQIGSVVWSPRGGCFAASSAQGDVAIWKTLRRPQMPGNGKDEQAQLII